MSRSSGCSDGSPPRLGTPYDGTSTRMNKYSQKAFFIFLIYVTSIVIQVSIDDLHLKNMLSISSVLLLFNLYVFVRSNGNTLCFLRPSVFGINYIFISMALGALTFVSDNVILSRMISESSRWTDGPTPIAFIAALVAVAIVLSDYQETNAAWLVPEPHLFKILTLLSATLATATLGSAANFIFVAETTAGLFMLYILHLIAVRNGKIRLLFYLAAIVPLTVLFAHDKRNVIFLIVPITFLELIIRDWRAITIQLAARAFVVVSAVAGLVLVATVLRTPGPGGISSIGETLSAVGRHVATRYFLGYASLNFEVVYTYFHTFNAINYVLVDRLGTLFGSTYLKLLFILIPRELLEWKPWGASYVYALRFDRAYRLAGGSWAVSMVGEAFVNFRIVGAVVLPFVLRMFDGVFCRWVLVRDKANFVSAVAALYFPVAFMNYARGSGLDSFVIMMTVATATAALGSIALHYGRKSRIWTVRGGGRT